AAAGRRCASSILAAGASRPRSSRIRVRASASCCRSRYCRASCAARWRPRWRCGRTRRPAMTDEARRTRWNERFSGEAYLFGTAPNTFLAAEASRLRRGDSVLCVADGEGRNGVFLAERGLDALSVDFSPVALEKAQRLARERGVRLRTQLADLLAWE